MGFLNSPLKWVGSKHKVLHQLFELEQFKNINKYDAFVEPFCGGGNVFLNVDHDNIIVSDNNPDLINFYYHVKHNIDDVISVSSELFKDISPESYYVNRDLFNITNELELKAALFLYMNKVGFRGLCRYSKKSGFNVAFGHYKNVNFPEYELIAMHKKLQNVTLCCDSFGRIFNKHLLKNGNNLGYCDPPYVGTFADYTSDGFNEIDHIDLNVLAVNAKSDIIISNSVEAKRIYKPDIVKDIEVTRGMSHDKGENKTSRKIVESLFQYI